MKKIIIVAIALVLVLLSIAGPVFAAGTMGSKPAGPSITVLSPNGGETLTIEQTQKLKWKSEGLKGNEPMLISLIRAPVADGPAYAEWVIAKVANTGSFHWTIPATLPGEKPTPIKEGNYYKIRVYCLKNLKDLYDQSDNYFTIISATNISTKCKCSGIDMVWYDSNSQEIFRRPYDCATDTCPGYRCLTGNEISPACYSLSECQNACKGRCLDIPLNRERCGLTP